VGGGEGHLHSSLQPRELKVSSGHRLTPGSIDLLLLTLHLVRLTSRCLFHVFPSNVSLVAVMATWYLIIGSRATLWSDTEGSLDIVLDD